MLRRIKKFIFIDPSKGIPKFRNYLEDLVRLEHPNIIQLLDFREDMFSFFLVFEPSSFGDMMLFSELEKLETFSEAMIAEVAR